MCSKFKRQERIDDFDYQQVYIGCRVLEDSRQFIKISNQQLETSPVYCGTGYLAFE